MSNLVTFFLTHLFAGLDADANHARAARTDAQPDLLLFFWFAPARQSPTSPPLQVHGDIHALLGGAFDCNVDMQEFHEERPEFSPGLLSFVLEYLTGKYWPGNSFLPSSNVCDTECVVGQPEPCGCTCSIDAMSISEDEVRAYKYCCMASPRGC